MMNVVIYRCPVCRQTRDAAEAVKRALEQRSGTQVEIADGEMTEFRVVADEQTVYFHGGEAPPSPDEVVRQVDENLLIGSNG